MPFNFNKRYLLHAGFWLLYFSITFFNELFLTSGSNEVLTIQRTLKTFVSEALLMCLKICLTYAVIYFFIPHWLQSKNKIAASARLLAVILIFVLVYRLIIQFITWPYILSIRPALNFESQLARYFYSLLEILQILGISITIKLLRLKIESSRLEKEFIQEKKQTELIRLRAQIHPHFLFNMLNSVYSLSRNNPEKSGELILKMSDLLRFMLYETEKKLITIESEVKIISDYIALQQIRFNNKVKVEMVIDSDNPQSAITPLIIFPLIENAFKHGVGSRSDHSFIYFKLNNKNNFLSVETRNSILENSVKTDNSHGIGQPNIKKQLEILYKEHSFKSEARHNEYYVTMNINLNSYVDFELLNN